MDVKTLSSMLGQQLKLDGKASIKTDESTEDGFSQFLQMFSDEISELPIQQENLLTANVGSSWLQLLLIPFHQQFEFQLSDSNLSLALIAGEKEEGAAQENISASLTEIMIALQPLVGQSDMPVLPHPDISSDEAIQFGLAVTNENNDVNSSSLLNVLASVPQVKNMPILSDKSKQLLETTYALTPPNTDVDVVASGNISSKNSQFRGVIVGSSQVVQESDTILLPNSTVNNLKSTAVDADKAAPDSQLAHNNLVLPSKFSSQSQTSSSAELSLVTPQPNMPPVTGSLSGTQLVNVESLSKAQLPNIPALHQITESVSMLTQQGQTEVRIHLQPETLGHLMVQLHLNDGNVAVRMLVETPQTQALIQEHLNQLKMVFATQGLQVNGLSVSVGQENPAFDMLGQRFNNGSNKPNRHRVHLSLDELEEVTESRPTTNMWGVLRAVDYQI